MAGCQPLLLVFKKKNIQKNKISSTVGLGKEDIHDGEKRGGTTGIINSLKASPFLANMLVKSFKARQFWRENHY